MGEKFETSFERFSSEMEKERKSLEDRFWDAEWKRAVRSLLNDKDKH